MNKHRQSAVADFMQSLEQLEELWGSEEAATETVFSDIELKKADADEIAPPSGSPQQPNAEQSNSQVSQNASQSETDA